MDQSLDQARIEGLTVCVFAVIRENYVLGPISRDRVLEALNALAVCAGTIIAGCDDGEEALAFFVQAVNQSILSAKERL